MYSKNTKYTILYVQKFKVCYVLIENDIQPTVLLEYNSNPVS